MREENSDTNMDIQYPQQPAYPQQPVNLQYPQQPVKKKKKWWLPIIIIIGILGIAFLIMYFFFSSTLAKWTNGAIGTASFTSLKEEELLKMTEGSQPTEKETDRVRKYAEKTFEKLYKTFNDEQREELNEIRAAAGLYVRLQLTGIEPTEEAITTAYNACYNEITRKPDSVRLAYNGPQDEALSVELEELIGSLNPFEVTAYAAGSYTIEDALESLYLHNVATGFTLRGEYDYALAMECIAAARNPYNCAIPLLMANLMRQSEELEYDARELLLYVAKLDPTGEAVWVTLGNYYLDRFNYDRAAGCFSKVFETVPQSGPANQGMMLAKIGQGDLEGAYLYMIEGAKDGYTSTVTYCYNRFVKMFKEHNDYLEWAGPIIESYGIQNLMDFKRSRTVFDKTLDTPGQQLQLDRSFSLPASGADIINSAGISMNAFTSGIKLMVANTLGEVNWEEAVTEDGINMGAIFGSEGLVDMYSLFGIDESMGEGIGNVLNNIDEDGNIDISGVLSGILGGKDEDSAPEEYKVNKSEYYNDNYEQECFWLSLLSDYYLYQYNRLTRKYYTEPADSFADNDLNEILGKTASIFKGSSDSQMLMTLLEGLLDNGSLAGADSQFTRERVQEMGKALLPVNRMIEQGYKEAVVLAEEYWLYSNNILSYIADDTIYNKYHFERNCIVTDLACFFPTAGAAFNAMLGLTCNEWAGMTYDLFLNDNQVAETALHDLTGTAAPKAVYPETPELPVSGMGEAVKPKFKIIFELPKPEDVATAVGVDLDDFGTESEPPVVAIVFGDDEAGEVIGNVEPGRDDQGSTTVIGETEIQETPISAPFAFKIKKIIEVSLDPKTGKYSISLGGFVGSGGIAFDAKSRDLTLYAKAGLDAGIGLSMAGGGASAHQGSNGLNGNSNNSSDMPSMDINVGSVTSGGYLKGTFNISKRQVVSAEGGAEFGVSVLNTGANMSVGYSPILGAKVETVSVTWDGKTATTQATTK